LHNDFETSSYNVYASRGCPYKCSYCANHVFASNYPGKKYYRVRSVDNVINEITDIKGKNPKLNFIAFMTNSLDQTEHGLRNSL